MSMSFLSRFALVGILGVFVFCVAGDTALAVKEPVTIPGSIWAVQGTLKLSGAGSGSETQALPADMAFGPIDGLAADAFQLDLHMDPADLEVTGTYTELKPGKPVLTVDVAALQLVIRSVFQSEGITLRSATLKVTPKNKKGVQSVRVFLNVKAQICEIPVGALSCKNGTLQYKGTGGHPAG